jgi:hypothetical protein
VALAVRHGHVAHNEVCGVRKEAAMSNRNLAHIAPPLFRTRLHSTRSLSTSIVEFLRAGLRAITAWRKHRRERKELYEFLASDHRAAADIGYRHHRP